MKSRLSCLLVVIVMAACTSPEDDDSDAAATGQLSGTAVYHERIAMPEGSLLELELVDVSADAEPLVISRQSMEVGNPPYAFTLKYDPTGIDPADQHELWLTLYLPDGTPRFSTELAVDLLDDAVGQVRLHAVELEEEREAASSQTWQCGDILLEADYVNGVVELTLPWRQLKLDAVQSASGVRYSDGQSAFQDKSEDEAVIVLGEQEPITCRPSSTRSPWALARRAGVSFRAVGNEPGWVIEVTEAPQPAIRLELDYGIHELEFDGVTVLPGPAGYVAEAPGNHAEINLVREPCRDSMVGWEFPVRVEMRLNEIDLVACGRFF